jgi:hypothetical protein
MNFFINILSFIINNVFNDYLKKYVIKHHFILILVFLVPFLLTNYYKKTISKLYNEIEKKNIEIEEKRIESIENVQFNKKVEKLILSTLKYSGDKTYISWIRIERIKDKYRIYFKDVYANENNDICSVRFKNALYNHNDPFDEVLNLDKNTQNYIDSLFELEVYDLYKDVVEYKRFDTLTYIFNHLIIKEINHIKFVIVKKNNNIIWGITFSAINYKNFKNIDNYITNIGITLKVNSESYD